MATKDWLTNIEAKNQVAIQKSGNESLVTKDWLSQVETTGASPYIKKTQIKTVAVSNQNNQPLIVTPNQMQFKPLPNPPPVSTILPTNQSPNLIKEAGQSFVTGLGGSIMTAGGAAKWLGADGIGTKLTKAGKDIIQSVPPVDTLPWQKAYDPRFWTTTVAQGAGSSVPMMVATIPLAVIGAYAAGTGAAALGIGALGRFVLSSIGGAALSRVAESTLEGGGTYDEAIAKGLSPEESKQAAQKTFAKNMALSGLDAVELATAFFPIKGSGIKNVLKRAVLGLASMGTEGAEEVVQGAISKSSLGEKYDKNEAITEFTVGTILGAGLPVAGNTFNVIKDKVATTFKSEYNQMQSKGKLNDIQIVDQIAETHPNEVKQIVNEVVSSLGNDSVVTPDQALTIASADGIKNTEVGKEITIKAVEAKANDKKVHIAIPEGKESTIVEVVEKSEPSRVIPVEIAKPIEIKEGVGIGGFTPTEMVNRKNKWLQMTTKKGNPTSENQILGTIVANTRTYEEALLKAKTQLKTWKKEKYTRQAVTSDLQRFYNELETPKTSKEFDNKTIYHSGQRSAEQVKEEGLHFSRNAQSQFGEGVYFSDNVETAQEYGDTNIQAEVNTKDYNLKVVEGKDQQAYLDKFNAKSVSEAVRKEGKYDGFIITNPDPQVGNTYVITNLDKLNEKITGKKQTKSEETIKKEEIPPENKTVEQPKTADKIEDETNGVLKDVENDIDKELARRAYYWTSFDPDKRAESEIRDYVNALKSDYETLKALAKTPEDIDKLNEMFAKYRAGYKSRVEKYLSAHSKVASSAVTGPARFNSAKNETKANNAHNAMTEMIDYREKMNKVITKELNPIASGVISGKTDDQLTQLNKKLEELKALQEKMKSANKIIKSGKNVNERLVSELGMTKEEVDELMKPDFTGTSGYPSFKLTNNNAKIKQTEARIANLTKKQEKFQESGNKEYSFDKGKVIFNYEENRLQIIYDSIPIAGERQILKKNGFRWSPKNKLWQRILGKSAIDSSVKILGEYIPKKIELKYRSAKNSIKEIFPNATIDYIESIVNPGKSMEVVTPNGGTLMFDVSDKEILIWSAGNPEGLREPGKGGGQITKAIKQLMELARKENKNISVLAPTGSGYWQHIGFPMGNLAYTSLTPSQISDLKSKEGVKVTEEVKPEPKVETPKTPSKLDEYLKNSYGVTLEKATKKQVRDSLSEIGEPIEYSPELMKKVSSTNIMDGVDILNGVVSRPVLVYGGKKLKVYTNGYYLVIDPEAADKINTEVIDKVTDKEMVKIEKILKEAGEPPNFERKQELRKEWIDSKVNEKYQYPNIESITKEIDKKYQVTKSYVLKNGRQSLLFISRDIDPNENRDDIYNYTSGNKVYGAIDYDYLSTIEKYFDKELSIRMDNPLKPVNLYNGDKLVAVIMPIRNDQIQKIRNLESQKQTNQPKTPSGHADVGGYSKVESFEKMIGRFRSIQTPELVQMTKDLLGDAPSMKKMKRALGFFYPKDASIKLDPKIFTDPDLVAKVLAHELGHATDWLDSKTMKRGNILGRIASLKNYLKKTLPEFEGAPGTLTKEDRARIKKEAEELSKNPQLVEEEVVIETKPVEPTDILAIWNDSTSSIRDPKLLEYIQKLDDAKKKQIAVAAMKGKIPEWVTFVREIKGKVTREVIKNSKADIKELYQKMIKDEIEKRRLYDYTTMKRELEDLSVMWKPFNPLQDKQFTKYRFSSPELYADAVSVLLNDPMLLKKEAPNFWRAFFNYISSKPSVQKSFTDTWNLLNKGEEAIFNQRNKTIDESFRKADEALQAKVAEQNRRDNNIVDLTRTLFDDRNYPIIKKIDQAIKAGKIITPNQNPLYALHGFNYLDGKLSNYVESRFEKIFTSSQKVLDGWKNLGKILFYERTINERGELANPWGYDPKTAKEDLRLLEKTFSKEDWKQLQEAKQQFRDAVQESIKIAEESGLYTKELLDQMKANPAYATYQVVDYIDTYISSKVYQQIGTLKDISNPATASVMKLISVFKAAERNNVKKLNIEFLSNNFPDEITEAKTRWNGHSIEAAEPKDPNQGLVVVMEKGKPKGYYVPKDIARVLQYEPNQTLDMLAKVTGYMSQSSLYRPLFTSLNLGFQSVNFFRDFMRYWKNIPDSNLGEALTSFPRAVVRYGQALPHAINRGLKISDKLVSEMKDAGILGATYNDYFKSDEDDQRQHIERILENTGVRPAIRKQNFVNRVLSPINFTLDMIENLGNIIESLPKIAGYLELNGKMDDAQLAEFLRTSIGSPDFRIGGEATKITNKAFLFSNAIKEGLKTDIAIATSNNPSRAGFWWKTILSNIVPAILVSAVLAGKFGDDLKKKMEKISEYDLTNYINIPLSTDERGKTVHLRVPMDETGRLIHGLVHKIIKTTKDGKASLDDLFNLLSFTGGLVPSISPSFTALGVIAEYLSGRNPYDSFRGRNIIPDNEFAAGQKESFPILFKWLLRNQGLGILVPTETYGDLSPSELQKKLNLPAVGNVIGRWIKVSDQGEAEKLKEITKESEKEKAQDRLDERRAINKAVDEYNQDKSQENKRRAKLGMVESLVGKAPYNKDERAEIKRLIKKFDIAVLKGKADTQINSLINAPTNDLKVELLKEISKTKTEKEMTDFLREVYKYKVVSSDVVKAYRRLK